MIVLWLNYSPGTDYSHCKQLYYQVCLSVEPASPQRRAVIRQDTFSASQARDLRHDIEYHVNFAPGRLQNIQSNMVAQVAAAAGHEVANVQPCVKSLLEDVMGLCRDQPLQPYLVDGTTGGLANRLVNLGRHFSDSANFKDNYNPDFTVFVDSVPPGEILDVQAMRPMVRRCDHALRCGRDKRARQAKLMCEVKTQQTIDNPTDVAKFLRDLEYVADLSHRDTAAGVLLAPNKMVPFELFKSGAALIVLHFPDIPLTEADAVAQTLAYAIVHDTFLGGAPADVDDPRCFMSFLGYGRTSFVFETASPRWPVAKVLTTSHKERTVWNLAINEAEQIDKIFRTLATNIDHFMDATLDATRAPRNAPDPTTPAFVPPANRGLLPVVYYSRRCQFLPAGYFRSSDPNFADHLQQLLEACAQMHAAGVVHNDLRESNLMVVGDPLRLVVGDFGYSMNANEAAQWRGGTIKTASLPLLDCIHASKRTYAGNPVNYTFSARDDLWSIASLCLHADDSNADDVSVVACKHFESNKTRCCNIIDDLWRAWSKFDPHKWGAAKALLGQQPVQGDIYAHLREILLRQSRIPA